MLEGESSVDESILTGELLPVDKVPGRKVFTETLNSYGYLKCKTLQVGSSTALGQILKLTSEATDNKALVARLADKISAVLFPLFCWLRC